VTNYALYPVWILNTKWREKNFRFAVNGQTGKVAGNLPVSPLKFFLFYMLFFLVIGGAAFGLTFWLSESALVGAIVGVLSGALFALLILLIMRRANKNVKFQYGAANYVRDNSLRILERKELYLYRTVSKTPRPKSNNRD
jgi:hypothetical protein